MENNLNHTRNNREATKGETITQLAHRHLLNRNHTTTDEEIKNARIEFTDYTDTEDPDLTALAKEDNTTVLPPLPFEENALTGNNRDKDQTSAPNPFDVLK